MGRDRFGRLNVPTPTELIRNWQRKQAVRLFDVVRAELEVEIFAVHETEGSADIILTPSHIERPKIPVPTDFSGFVWGIELRKVSERVRAALPGSMVQIMGVPSRETPGYGTANKPIVPYNDRLFRRGELQVQPLEAGGQNIAEPISLGTVIGLNLIRGRDTRVVW